VANRQLKSFVVKKAVNCSVKPLHSSVSRDGSCQYMTYDKITK